MAKKYSIQDVADIVDSEGLGYAITGYLSSANIEDDNLRELWIKAAEVLDKIEKTLEPYTE
ncbi:hypothetical protein [Niallia taxi]|uniref:hypothetical protein n=1 Tax=Niallia taxi TaxID=2499688 RepID=UPI003008B8A6